MQGEHPIGVLITLFSGVVAITFLAISARSRKLKPLNLLFLSVLLCNVIWFLVIFFIFFKSFFPVPDSPRHIYWLEFVVFSILYLIRFGLLLFFLLLIHNILGLKIPRKSISIFRFSVIFLSLLWFVGWIEIPLLGSRFMIDQSMLLTDFLVFVTVIAAALYLRYRTAFLPGKEYKKAVMNLSTFIIVPLAVACLKLVIGPSLGKISYILERSILYAVLVFLNVSVSWWILRYKEVLSKPVHSFLGEGSAASEKLLARYRITKREMEVIELLCMGKSNKDIADQLFISVETVKDHNYKIFQKTDVKSRLQLVNLVNSIK